MAIVFQELLCGTRPFNGSNTKQLLMQHLNGTPDVESLPFSDQPIVMRGLSKKPEHRYPSCTDMVKALRAAGLMAPVSTPKPPSQAIGSDSVVMTRAAHLLGSETPPKGSGDYPTTVPPSASSPVVAFDKLRLTTPSRPSSPALVTPRLVTPKDANGQIAQTPVRQPVVQTAMMGSLGIADRERAESGVLQPAFFIALGQLGHELLRSIQGTLRDRFGTLDAIPHVRFLTIDTDPLLMEKATGPEPIPEPELLLTRMNRPQHYLSKEGLPSVEAWLPPGALYKLPKQAEPTHGQRAYGRLAFVDHYRSITQRFRQMIEPFLNDRLLDEVAGKVNLPVRSNRVRVYLLGNLGGGTCGMAIDLAYVLKNELRSVGYRNPDVRGYFVVPPADKTAPRGLALANTYAALRELEYFHQGRNVYTQRFENREAPVQDSTGPFQFCTL
ncbi:MAG: tubulin-like doman-containing protein, partial [Gemmataceae bacterium]